MLRLLLRLLGLVFNLTLQFVLLRTVEFLAGWNAPLAILFIKFQARFIEGEFFGYIVLPHYLCDVEANIRQLMP